MTPATSPAAVPSVGIFWSVPDAAGVLVSDATPLPEAEAYGSCLTHPRGHYELWEAWQALGPAVLARLGLPSAIAWLEYEECPRGRIVFETTTRMFILYADRSLQTPPLVAAIRARFALGAEPVTVKGDPHYRTGLKPDRP
jgi:hypothetical protein